MKHHALLTAVGNDRVGIVEDISKEALDRACNIEESRMAVLGGDFAVLMLLSGPEESIQQFLADAEGVGKKLGLTLQVKKTSGPAGAEGSLPYSLESTSLDSPGIVKALASVLRRLAVNISDLETSTDKAPWTGAPLFTLKARLIVPASLPIQTLRKELGSLELEFNLDLQLRPIA
jgi:glycine cleavage system transcriptional repressor